MVLGASPARSHDPSAWGGLFRSRDHGATWVSANGGRVVGGALALAISPTDVNHLLLGTDSGLLRSRNGGRDWTIEAPAVLVGSVFATVFAGDGQRAVVATGLGIFHSEAENNWQESAASGDATPARAIVRGAKPGRIYLAGWTGLYRSDDEGASWSSAADGLPQGPAAALLVVPGSPETLYAIVGGGIWASVDGARSWASRGPGLSAVNVDALALDSKNPARLWAVGHNRLFRSDDGGASWQAVGRPLPEANTRVRGIAAAEKAVVITTDRGLYRSIDDGEHWTLVIENLPAHLEGGPLAHDPVDPATLYAGFALIPYPELWRQAAERDSALARVNLSSLAGGVALLVVVALGALAALRRLGHHYRTPTLRAPATRDRRMEKSRR